MKKLYYILAVIFFLLVSLLGYFQYQKQISYQTNIHQETDFLCKINTYEIAKNIESYIKIYDSINSKSLVRTIEIPTNIFIYTIKNKKKTTFFGSAKITDYPLFEKLTEKDFNKSIVNSKIKMLTSKDQKLTILYDKKMAAFSYSQTKEKVTDILNDILQKKNVVSVEKSLFKNITSKKGQIIFYDGVNEGILNLTNNRIKGIVYINSKKITIPEKIECPTFEEENIVSLWLQADIKSIIPKKTYIFDKYSLDSDSVLSSFQNEIRLEVTKPIIQKDSVITYDYDDNFEKVEIVKINKTVILGLSLWVKSNTGQLYNYLYKQQVINTKGEVNKKIFPLYQLYTLKEDKTILFSTRKEAEKAIKNPSKKLSNNFFYLKIDFDKLRKQEDFSFLYKYVTNFKNLEMKASPFENRIQIYLDMEVEDTIDKSSIIHIWNLINKQK